MSRIYCYCELSPRGFGNEIEATVACDTKKEYEKLVDAYCKGINEIVFKVKYKDLNKRFVVSAYLYIKMLEEKDENKKWALKDSIEELKYLHNSY